MALSLKTSDENRVPIHCRVSPQTLQFIEESFPFAGNIGRKVDLVVKEMIQSRRPPREKPTIASVREFLAQPGSESWTIRKIASYLHCSKSLVSLVRSGDGKARNDPTRKLSRPIIASE